MNKNLSEEDIKVIESIRAIYKLDSGKELSFERVADLLKVTDLLFQIIRGGFVCSKCGEAQHFYEIRQ